MSAFSIERYAVLPRTSRFGGEAASPHAIIASTIYRWELERRGRAMAIDVPGQLVLDDVRLMAQAAAAGLGIAYVPEPTAEPYLADRRLVTVLESWCLPIPGLFLYYPANRHVPPPSARSSTSSNKSGPARRRCGHERESCAES